MQALMGSRKSAPPDDPFFGPSSRGAAILRICASTNATISAACCTRRSRIPRSRERGSTPAVQIRKSAPLVDGPPRFSARPRFRESAPAQGENFRKRCCSPSPRMVRVVARQARRPAAQTMRTLVASMPERSAPRMPRKRLEILTRRSRAAWAICQELPTRELEGAWLSSNLRPESLADHQQAPRKTVSQ